MGKTKFVVYDSENQEAVGVFDTYSAAEKFIESEVEESDPENAEQMRDQVTILEAPDFCKKCGKKLKK